MSTQVRQTAHPRGPEVGTSGRVPSGHEMINSYSGHAFLEKFFTFLPGTRTLLGAPGIATRNKDATKGSWHPC